MIDQMFDFDDDVQVRGIRMLEVSSHLLFVCV